MAAKKRAKKRASKASKLTMAQSVDRELTLLGRALKKRLAHLAKRKK